MVALAVQVFLVPQGWQHFLPFVLAGQEVHQALALQEVQLTTLQLPILVNRVVQVDLLVPLQVLVGLADRQVDQAALAGQQVGPAALDYLLHQAGHQVNQARQANLGVLLCRLRQVAQVGPAPRK